MLKVLLAQFPKLKVLGDTHLGRRFVNDVPLHRRGEREQAVNTHFFHALTHEVTAGDLVVQTGDIFDSFTVSIATVLYAVQCLEWAAEQTGAQYYVYRGNHDGSRDDAIASSFDLLAKFFENHEQVHVVKDLLLIDHDGMRVGFMPWHPFKSAFELATEMKMKFPQGERKADVIFTHCDLDAIAGKDFNALPYGTLNEITNAVVNGHIHEAQERAWESMKVVMPGSMEPYSHGEDPDGEFYVTMTLSEFLAFDHSKLKHKNVRILLEENESLPDEIPDCLSFTAKRVKKVEDFEEGDDSEQVVMEDFSLTTIISDSLRRAGVADRISSQILNKFEETRNVEK